MAALKKRFGFFRRVHQTPFKVLIGGKVKELKNGDVELLDYDTFKDVWGFKFEGFPNFKPIRQVKNINENPKLLIEEFVEPSIPVVVEKEELNEQIIVESEEIVSSENIINTLKGLKKQDFFVMKKDECKKHLDNLGADYSNIDDDKWALVKFLQKIIKEL